MRSPLKSRDKPPGARDASHVRREAEKRLRRRHAASGATKSDADTKRLVHELQVHQIELEMQNEELQEARAVMEVTLDKYTELYDFAPVGYFTLDQKGVLKELNLTGATMLGASRSLLVQRRLQEFVSPSSRPVIERLLASVFTKPGKHECEALLHTSARVPFWADLQALSAPWLKGGPEYCRLAISNITALKRGEEAQRHVESLAFAVQSANREIAQRRAVEKALKESEQGQRELLAKSQVLQAQLRYLTHQVLRAQEEERKKISRELHDEIAQILAGITVQLATLAEAEAIRPGELRKRIVKTRRLVEQSIDVVHRFARRLRPTLLDDLGLIPALRSFIKELAGRKQLRIQFTAYPGAESLDSTRRTVLYRVAQEALTNVVRHARARNVSVRVVKIRDSVRLAVQDDGRSFASQRMLAASQDGRLGLLGMRERVEMVGGRFTIVSAPGVGTTITADIPLDRL